MLKNWRKEENQIKSVECNTLWFTLQSVIIFIRIIKVVHLKDAATGGGAAGGVGAEEDEVGQQNRHLGEHMDDFYIGRMGDHV